MMDAVASYRSTVAETLNTAKEYLSKLQELLNSLEVAQNQVETSSCNTLQDIDSTFDTFIAHLTETLNKRRNYLKKDVFQIKTNGLRPLNDCRDVILKKLTCTKTYIAEGDSILNNINISDPEIILKFSDRASDLGSLPAVPNLEEVPDISFQCSVDNIKSQLERTVTSAGKVSMMGPVQLTGVEEKPGALLVQWEEVDAERPVDVHSFRLQSAYGDVIGQPHLFDANFHDVYLGPEVQHLVRDLKPGVPYTFRVCCRIEGDTDWSAWSLPKVASTSQEPFCWNDTNENYHITNENKIATKISEDPSVLYSNAAQFGPGHSIEFTILESGTGCSDEGLALVDVRTEDENLFQPGILILNAKGSVFVDGMEKTTKLPPLEKGSKVSFTCEFIRDKKIRVNIDSNNKTVTYDWTITNPQLKLFFAVCFGQKGWKVLVE